MNSPRGGALRAPRADEDGMGRSAVKAPPRIAETPLAAELRTSLGGVPKRLPAHYLYDALGSALFEAITELPEYGLTRADERILRTNAAEIVGSLPLPIVVAELGSGSGRKTRWILTSLADRQRTVYVPIDRSRAALARCRAELGDVDRVRIEPIEADYRDGLAHLARRRAKGDRILLLFLGSTIGNFDPPEAEAFLRAIRSALEPGDGLLLGTDLVKPAADLLRAYDDPLGVTAAFDRNLLVRLNREFSAGFDLARFHHEARWNGAARRVEMHLVATQAHAVSIPGLDLHLDFRAGETIWTESSYKFEPGEAARIGARTGFAARGRWIDDRWPFEETLLLAC